MSRQTTERYQAYGCSGVVIWIIGLIVGFVVGINSPWAGWIIILVSLLLPFLLFGTIEFLKKQDKEGMRPASPMVRRKRDFLEWEFTKKMNAVRRR